MVVQRRLGHRGNVIVPVSTVTKRNVIFIAHFLDSFVLPFSQMRLLSQIVLN